MLLSLPLMAKPFWTEKAAYEEGDKIYFVGTFSNATTIEEGRINAFEAAKTELINYTQISDVSGLTIHTQMNYEEKNKAGNFDVYRLLWVDSNFVNELKEKNEQLVKENIEKLNASLLRKKEMVAQITEKQNQIKEQDDTIEQKLKVIELEINKKSKDILNLKCGMSISQVRDVFGSPSSQRWDAALLEGYGYDSTAYFFLRYGNIWVTFYNDQVNCLSKTIDYKCRGILLNCSKKTVLSNGQSNFIETQKIVYVKGYYRKNGTYIAPHYRSAPDKSLSNNWSTKGNLNPYTGKVGTKNGG